MWKLPIHKIDPTLISGLSKKEICEIDKNIEVILSNVQKRRERLYSKNGRKKLPMNIALRKEINNFLGKIDAIVHAQGAKLLNRYALKYHVQVQDSLLCRVLIPRVRNFRLSKQSRLTKKYRVFFAEYFKPLEDNAFGLPEQPLVSVVIPVKNNFMLTLGCLNSIHVNAPSVDFEIIVVDDGSTDETPSALGKRNDIIYIRNNTSRGFVYSCNAGAQVAKGKYLFFLNNDTIVLQGWLDRSVETIEKNPQIALVGSKLIYPEGILQEAGCIIWRDGTGAQWGHKKDPCDPRYNFLRDVDYSSGAGILVVKDKFFEVGGFDDMFSPAYYEDTDLAFKLRDRGWRVVYQPKSEIIHLEGATAGRDIAKGIKSYQEKNRIKFIDKWYSILPSHGDRSLGDRAANRFAKFNVLVVDSRVPMPDKDSGSIDMWNLLRILKGLGVHVFFLPLRKIKFKNENQRYIENLQSIGVECVYSPYIVGLEDFLFKKGGELDLVILTRVNVAKRSFDIVKKYCPDIPIIFNPVDLHHIRTMRMAEVEKSEKLIKKAKIMKYEELDMIKRSDMTIVVSTFEKEYIKKMQPEARVEVIPIIREMPDIKMCKICYEDRKNFIFIGDYSHRPNVDAAHYLCRKIWPLASSRMKGVDLIIAGSNLPDDIRKYASGNVKIFGYIEHLEKVFAGIRVSVAPLRFGAGAKGKIVTSLSFGVPCVATSVAIEGMELEKDKDILVADDVETFANLMVDLYSNKSKWLSLSVRGRDTVMNINSLQKNVKRISSLFVDLLACS